MSRIGEKIADEIPESWVKFVHEHPRVMYAISLPLLGFCAWNLIRAVRLHVLAEMFVAARESDAARAASEALGG